jgi:sigma-E factor negative regulatory protein RseA
MDRISALMDGELDSAEAEREIGRLKTDVESRERWESFHVVGDALRGDPVLSAGFSNELSKRLVQEPTVLAPRSRSRQARRFTTYALSAAASISAMALVAWVAVYQTGQGGLIADSGGKGNATPVVAALPASASSDGLMNEYLLAHQGFSPSTAIQGLAPYIRSVSTTHEEGR